MVPSTFTASQAMLRSTIFSLVGLLCLWVIPAAADDECKCTGKAYVTSDCSGLYAAYTYTFTAGECSEFSIAGVEVSPPQVNEGLGTWGWHFRTMAFTSHDLRHRVHAFMHTYVVVSSTNSACSTLNTVLPGSVPVYGLF